MQPGACGVQLVVGQPNILQKDAGSICQRCGLAANGAHPRVHVQELQASSLPLGKRRFVRPLLPVQLCPSTLELTLQLLNLHDSQVIRLGGRLDHSPCFDCATSSMTDNLQATMPADL